MKIYITSIGEKTTEICCEQFKKFSFEVILLDKAESWFDKYRSFINMANEDCLRVDADVVPNVNVKDIPSIIKSRDELMIQFSYYDLYRNNVYPSVPIYYSKKAIDIIKKNIHKLDSSRPETSAWRLPEINPYTFSSKLVVGFHGFFQSQETMNQAKENKIARGQIQYYDFDLVDKLIKL